MVLQARRGQKCLWIFGKHLGIGDDSKRFGESDLHALDLSMDDGWIIRIERRVIELFKDAHGDQCCDALAVGRHLVDPGVGEIDLHRLRIDGPVIDHVVHSKETTVTLGHGGDSLGQFAFVEGLPRCVRDLPECSGLIRVPEDLAEAWAYRHLERRPSAIPGNRRSDQPPSPSLPM